VDIRFSAHDAYLSYSSPPGTFKVIRLASQIFQSSIETHQNKKRIKQKTKQKKKPHTHIQTKWSKQVEVAHKCSRFSRVCMLSINNKWNFRRKYVSSFDWVTPNTM